jgi:hypothetical protein
MHSQSLPAQAGHRRSVEFSPLSPIIDIWAVQFGRRFGERNELLLGGAFANIGYDRGRSHAPTAILGYRRYLWRGLHLEYQLWPSYNWYFENVEKKYYRGFELWNELRPGYTIDFHIAGHPVFVNLQYLIGDALYGGNKPASFRQQADAEGTFTTPMVFLGWRY